MFGEFQIDFTTNSLNQNNVTEINQRGDTFVLLYLLEITVNLQITLYRLLKNEKRKKKAP